MINLIQISKHFYIQIPNLYSLLFSVHPSAFFMVLKHTWFVDTIEKMVRKRKKTELEVHCHFFGRKSCLGSNTSPEIEQRSPQILNTRTFRKNFSCTRAVYGNFQSPIRFLLAVCDRASESLYPCVFLGLK